MLKQMNVAGLAQMAVSQQNAQKRMCKFQKIKFLICHLDSFKLNKGNTIYMILLEFLILQKKIR